MYVQIINDKPAIFFDNLPQIYSCDLGRYYNEEELLPLGFFPVIETLLEYDPKEGVQSEPIFTIGETSVAKTYEFIPFTDGQKLGMVEEKQKKIREAALAFEQSYITGSGIGLITLGVAQGKPKCVAVEMWIKGLWTDAFTRIANVTYNSDVNTDFMNNGEIPFNVQELMAEMYA